AKNGGQARAALALPTLPSTFSAGRLLRVAVVVGAEAAVAGVAADAEGPPAGFHHAVMVAGGRVKLPAAGCLPLCDLAFLRDPREHGRDARRHLRSEAVGGGDRSLQQQLPDTGDALLHGIVESVAVRRINPNVIDQPFRRGGEDRPLA